MLGRYVFFTSLIVSNDLLIVVRLSAILLPRKVVSEEMRIKFRLEVVFPLNPHKTVTSRNHSDINRTSYCFQHPV